MYTIRAFDYSTTDYETLVTVRNLARPEAPRSVAEWRHLDSTKSQDFPHHRDFVLTNNTNTVVAFADYGQSQFSYHPQKYNWSIVAHPDYDDTTVYDHYFAHLLNTLTDKNLIALTTEVLEDKTVLLDYLRSQHFTEIMRTNVSELDVDAFDLSHWSSAEHRLAETNIQIKSLSQLMQSDPQWQHKLYELDWLIMQDIPSPEPPVKSTFEQFTKSNFHHPKFDPDFWFIAVHEGDYIGLSQFWSNREDKDLLKTGDSGVIREYRRRGVVTALKIHGFRFAKELGVPKIRTSNESNNPMYQINLHLGFQPIPSWIQMEKAL